MYKLVWVLGYRLHECARCRAPRFIPRHDRKSPHSSQLGKGPASALPFAEKRGALRTAEESPEPKVTKQVTAADSSDRGLRRCPVCGSTAYHRTQRTTLERILLRPQMARCEKCGLRFPYPGHREKYPGPVESGGARGNCTPPCGGEKGSRDGRREIPTETYPASNCRRFLEPWIAPLSGLRQQEIPPYQADHPGASSCCAQPWLAARGAGRASPIPDIMIDPLTQ